jgi:hypothetical protein
LPNSTCWSVFGLSLTLVAMEPANVTAEGGLDLGVATTAGQEPDRDNNGIVDDVQSTPAELYNIASQDMKQVQDL